MSDRPVFTLPPVTYHPIAKRQAGELIDWWHTLLGVAPLWKRTQGEGVKVAVLDTGVASHPDLEGQIEDAQDFTGSPYGWQDMDGHGTHCAGLIAAKRGNGLGVVGVAPKCRLLIAKVLGDEGWGESAWIERGIRWAMDRGANVVSMSFGSAQRDAGIAQAITEAVARGVVPFAAAGNSGPRPNTITEPAAQPGVIAVAAVDRNAQVMPWSSRGENVQVAAPGDRITSLSPAGLATLSGTSMACPIVAGVGALALAAYEGRGTGADMREWLKSSCRDIDAPGRDTASGWGLIDPAKLVDAIPAPAASELPAWLLALLEMIRLFFLTSNPAQQEHLQAKLTTLRHDRPGQ